jgi:hypothetical protein
VKRWIKLTVRFENTETPEIYYIAQESPSTFEETIRRYVNHDRVTFYNQKDNSLVFLHIAKIISVVAKECGEMEDAF